MGVSEVKASCGGGSNSGADKVHFNISIVLEVVE